MSVEKLQFQTETKRLLDLVINSIYTNKEIFLRELISNASDALDKLRIESLTDSSLGDITDPEIFITPNSETKTITISDNGIGMTRDEVISNIGTIAKSGTKDFLDKLRESTAAAQEELIGQFGVGFYSAFIVADKVELITRRAGTDSAVKWTSDGAGEFELEDCDKDSHGTTIVLHLKPEFTGSEYNFSDINVIEQLIKKYSDFIRYPIKMTFEVTEKEDEPVTLEVRTVNTMKPLWVRNKQDITEEEYNEFFKQQFHEWNPPLDIIHVKAEGTTEYNALLYVPKEAPVDLYYPDHKTELQLYVKHVLVMNKCEDILPVYFGFIRGLIDSPDLSLNISRETLQQNVTLKIIGKALEKNIIRNLKKMLKDDRDKYEKFFAEFGKSLKIGIYNAMFNRQIIDSLKDLLIFRTSLDDKFYTFEEYVSRMSETQKDIYYAVGSDYNTIDQLPQMELLKEKNLEVLYLIDPIDEFVFNALNSYNEYKLQSVTKEDFILDDTEYQQNKKKIEEATKIYEELLKDIKEAIGSTVKEVRLTTNLKNSAFCIITDANGPSLATEKNFYGTHRNIFRAVQIFEINPDHDIFKKLIELHKLGKESEQFKDFCVTIHSLALLTEGVPLDNPTSFVNKVTGLLLS